MRFRGLGDLAQLREAGLRELWRSGSAPPPEELAGWVFRGWNTSLAAARSPVGGRAFAKGLFLDGAAVRGCNFTVRIHDAAWWIDLHHPFGFFAAYPTTGAPAWRGRPPALLLDYGRRPRPEREPEGSRRPALRIVSWLARSLRDLIVRPPDAAPGLYVGRAFLSSTLQLPVTCFALERWRPLASLPRSDGHSGEGPRASVEATRA